MIIPPTEKDYIIENTATPQFENSLSLSLVYSLVYSYTPCLKKGWKCPKSCFVNTLSVTA